MGASLSIPIGVRPGASLVYPHVDTVPVVGSHTRPSLAYRMPPSVVQLSNVGSLRHRQRILASGNANEFVEYEMSQLSFTRVNLYLSFFIVTRGLLLIAWTHIQ